MTAGPVPEVGGSLRSSLRSERGSATVWGLTLCLVLVLIGAVLVLLAQVAVVRHRAAGAADLSALAAAGRPFEPTAACELAGRVAAASAARLRHCRVAGEVAEVTVEVPLRGWLAQLPPARAVARAGPQLVAPTSAGPGPGP